MATGRIGHAEFVLQKLALQHGEQLSAEHQWISEEDRWLELVFSLLSHSVDHPQWFVRAVVGRIATLRLLSVSALASPDGVALARAKLMAQEAGLSAEGVEKALNAAAEAAKSIEAKFSGKLQRLLRAESEKTLANIRQALEINSIDQRVSGLALTFWLQNVMNAPLSLRDEEVSRFSADEGLGPADIIEAADALDLNLALVDDLIRLELTLRSQAIAGASESNGVR